MNPHEQKLPATTSALRPWRRITGRLTLLLAAFALGLCGGAASAADKSAKKAPLPKAPKNLQISAPSKPRAGRTGASPERRAALRDAGNRLAEARRAVQHYQRVLARLPADQIAKLPDSERRAAQFAERRAALVQQKRWYQQLQIRARDFETASQDYVFSHNKWTANNPRPDAPSPVRSRPAPQGVITPNPAAFPAAALAARAASQAAAAPPAAPRRQAQALAPSPAAARPKPVYDQVPPEPAPAVPAAPSPPPVPAPLAGSAADPPPPFDPRFAPPPPVPARRLPGAGANPGPRVVYSQLPAAASQSPGGGLQQRDARAQPAGLLRGVQNALAASEQLLLNPD